MAGVRLRLCEVEVFERWMPFTRPFRFGAVTVEAAPQAFVRVVVEVEGRAVAGASAEMMMPKWFDKNPAKSPAQTIADLRASLAQAARSYAEATRPDTAFGHHVAAAARQGAWAGRSGLPALVASYGPAVIDKAILDALLKGLGVDLAGGLRANVPGLDARLAPDLDDATVATFLQGLDPSPGVAIRHTIGLLDALDGPDGLAAEIEAANLAFFKIKIGGDLAADVGRLRALARALPRHAPGFRATLDANEQYDPDRLAGLVEALAADPALAPLRERLLYIEQPFDRAITLQAPLGGAADAIPFIIDEADGAYDAYPRAVALGYRGVSSKSCKGLYKSLLNAARAQAWNRRAGQARFFVTGEDLTCQAGLAVEQDAALAAMLGLDHVERNGHHYVDGFGPAPQAEAAAFASAHPDLYRERNGRLGLAVEAGRLSTASLFGAPGFAGGAEPDWSSLRRDASTTTPIERISA